MPSMGPQFPIDLGDEALQTLSHPAEDSEGYYQSHRGKKSKTRDYKNPPPIPALPGRSQYGVYSDDE